MNYKKQTEINLKEDQYMLDFQSRVLSQINDAVIVFDAEGKIKFWNDGAQRMYGYSSDEVLGKSSREVLGYDLSDEQEKEITKKIFENGTWRGTYKNKNKSGETLVIESLTTIMKDDNGEVIGLLSVIRDISDKIASEQKLKYYNEQLDIIIKSVSDGITVQDKNYNIVYANDAAAKLSGFNNAKEFLETPISEIVKRFEIMDEHDNPFPVEKLPGRLAFQGIKNASATLKFRIKETGEIRWSLVESSPVFDETGNVIQAINVFHDITELKTNEEKLKLTEKRFRMLFEQSPISMQIFDPKGIPVQVNKAWEELFGVTLEQIRGYNVLEDDQLVERKVMEVIRKAFEGEQASIPPIKYIPDRGKFKDMETWSRALIYPVKNDDGSIHEVILMHENITDQKKAQEQLEDSLKEKEVLLKEIHHRVKNNLQIISSLLSLQSNYISDEATNEIIRDSQNRVKSMALIHEKLYQSKNLSKINFKEYIEELTANVFKSYYGRSTKVKCELDIENISLNVDLALSLGLIINELISNSLKHAFNNYKGVNAFISVKVDYLKDGLRLEVKDNGQGFPENIDFRETESLGLQLVNTLVDQHKGKIEMNGNEGTTFILRFPKGNL